jgi:hypothetical protein
VNSTGEHLWDVPKYYVLYDIKTHATMPSRIVSCGGSIDVFDEMGNFVVKTAKDDILYAYHIEIFPDEQGKLSVIAVGSGNDQTPLIVRYNDGLEPVWKASVSDRINGLAMLEPRGEKRHFVIATNNGELLVFDQNGMLEFQDKLQGAKENDNPIYGIKAGLLGDKKYAFSIGAISSILIYEIRP